MLAAFLLVLTLNRQTILLSFAGAFIAATYPLAKRFTNLPQVYLGVAFSWGIPMAFSAQHADLMPLAWWLLATNLLWTVAYDTMYAMADRPDDVKAGIKSTAILFGRFDLLINATLQVMALLSLALIGRHLALGGVFYLGLLGAACTGVYRLYLCKDRDRQRCFQAFLNNIWFGGFCVCRARASVRAQITPKPINMKTNWDKELHWTTLVSEKLVLAIIGALTMVAVAMEIYELYLARRIELADLFLLFIYAEIIGMVGAFYSSSRIPVTLPIIIAITALCRLVVLRSKDNEPWVLMAEAAAILVLAGRSVDHESQRLTESREEKSIRRGIGVNTLRRRLSSSHPSECALKQGRDRSLV